MMKKKFILPMLVVILIFGMCFYLMKKNNVDQKIDTTLETLNSYHLEANMEMLFNDELKTYKVDVDYLKQDQDLFKVTLYDKTLNQSQIIIRNEQGVLVYTPTLNQVYQFKSDWPFNSEKPYIYQTLLSYFDQEHELEKIKEGYLLKSTVSYPHDDKIDHQEITFDKNMVPISVILFDASDIEQIKVHFTSFTCNESIDTNIFKVENVQEESVSVLDTSDFPLLPLEVLGTTLVDQQVCVVGEETMHILQFAGDKSFTMIQSIPAEKESLEVIESSAEFIDLISHVALYENQELKSLYPGVVCSIYSDTMTKLEMIEVASSLQNEVLK